MPVYAFEGIVPVVDATTYLHPMAVLIGMESLVAGNPAHPRRLRSAMRGE